LKREKTGIEAWRKTGLFYFPKMEIIHGKMKRNIFILTNRPEVFE
jgi:hypothetical protein